MDVMDTEDTLGIEWMDVMGKTDIEFTWTGEEALSLCAWVLVSISVNIDISVSISVSASSVSHRQVRDKGRLIHHLPPPSFIRV
jgi:hypothetical protein